MWETEGKRPLGRHKRRWEDNIKTDRQEWDGKAWTGLIWLRFGTGGRGLVNAVMNVFLP